MRKYTIPQSMEVEYLVSTSSTQRLSDHLGSTGITTDTSGAKVSEMRYKPWGEVRSSWTSGQSTTPAYELTKYTYTGQYSYTADFGLMFYNARWYDPALGRFAQADTIVPGKVNGFDPYLVVSYSEIDFLEQLNKRNIEALEELRGEKEPSKDKVNFDLQGFDRFSYAKNNPINYNDPTGHCGDPVSGTACMALLPTGPVGWIIIGVLLVVDVIIVANLIETWETPTTTTTTTTEKDTLDLVVTVKRKGDLQKLKNVEDKFGMTNKERDAFSDYLHDLKEHGQGGSANDRGDFTQEELERLADEFLKENRGK